MNTSVSSVLKTSIKRARETTVLEMSAIVTAQRSRPEITFTPCPRLTAEAACAGGVAWKAMETTNAELRWRNRAIVTFMAV